MKITVKAHSLLDELLPVHAGFEQVEVEVETGCTMAGLIERLRFPAHRVNLAYLDGRLVPRERWRASTLRDGGVVTLWPLMAGG